MNIIHCRCFVLAILVFLAIFSVKLTEAAIQATALTVKGEVKVARDGDVQNAEYLAVGTQLSAMDVLLVGDSVDYTARILCPNLTVQNARFNEFTSLRALCGQVQDDDRVLRAGSGLQSKLGGSALDVPYVISPRYTKLLSLGSISWNALHNVTGYTVYVCNFDETNCLKKYVRNPFLQLTDEDKEAFEKDVNYKVTVIPDSGKYSVSDPGGDLGFKIVSKEEAKVIRADVSLINSINSLNDDEKAVALAEVYAANAFNQDAIKVLKNTSQHSKNPYFNRRLGELYLKIGLNRLAEQALGHAKELLDSNSKNQEALRISAGLDEARNNINQSGQVFVPASTYIAVPE